MTDVEEEARREDQREGVPSLEGPLPLAKEELPDTLVLMGEHEIKAEAQRMTLRAFPNAAPATRSNGSRQHAAQIVPEPHQRPSGD